MKIKTLKNNQQIKTTMDKYKEVITVGTVEGYAKHYNQDPKQAVIDCLENMAANPYGGHCLAYTNKAAACLTNDPPEIKARQRAESDKKYADAVLILDGETVEIEGRLYNVKYMGIQYSDPIHFRPVKN